MGSSLVTLTGSRLTQSLLALVVRLLRFCKFAGRIAPVFRSWSAWLWRSLWTFTAHHRIQLHANDDPGPLVRHNLGTVPEEPTSGGPAPSTTPPPVDWHKMLSRLRERSAKTPMEHDLIPATPESGSQRYKTRRVKDLPTPDDLVVPIGQKTLLSSLPSVSQGDGWTRHVHPEGVVLFYHEEFRIFTEHNPRNSDEEAKLFACAAKLVQQAIDAKDGVTLDDLTHIVLNVDDDHDWHYYFVDHTNRLLFWVNTVVPRTIGIDLRAIDGLDHLKYMIESFYWYTFSMALSGTSYTMYNMKYRKHCEYHPQDHVLPTQAFEDLRGMLNYAKIDVLTTDSSSSPFGQDELAAMLGLLDSLKGVSEIADPYSVWAIARLMAYFTENQFLNFYGQACARLDADSALFGKMNWNRKYWFKTINVFLLGFPNEHALRLQRVFVDGMIIQPRWKDFINRLTTELSRYTIFSTVMLAVNFSLLSAPGVVPNAALPAGPIQIIVYCSVVSTVASIVFSFVLLNVYSNPRLLIAGNALNAMWDLSQTKTGMACLAITHSLPIASLIWSIVLFSVALSVYIFGPKQRVTVWTLFVEYLIIVIFVVMGVVVMWGFSKNDEDEDVSDMITTPTEKDSRRRRDLEEGPPRPTRTNTPRSRMITRWCGWI